MDLHRGGSSPLARLLLGQGTDSEQTPSSYTVWMVGVGVHTVGMVSTGVHTLDQNIEYEGPLPFLCFAGCCCFVLSHNWDNDDLASVLNL